MRDSHSRFTASESGGKHFQISLTVDIMVDIQGVVLRYSALYVIALGIQKPIEMQNSIMTLFLPTWDFFVLVYIPLVFNVLYA
jgi:hypothetical protein